MLSSYVMRCVIINVRLHSLIRLPTVAVAVATAAISHLMLFLILFVFSFTRALMISRVRIRSTRFSSFLMLFYMFARHSMFSIGFQAQQQSTNKINAIGALCLVCTNAILFCSVCVYFPNPPIQMPHTVYLTCTFTHFSSFSMSFACSQIVLSAFVCVCPL